MDASGPLAAPTVSAAGRLACAGRGLARGLGWAFLGALKDLSRLGGAARDCAGGALRGDRCRLLAGAGAFLVRVALVPADLFLTLAGCLISGVQTALGLEPPGRPLSPRERALLEPLFGPSLDLGRVRVKEGRAGLLTLPGRPFVMGDWVYAPPGRAPLPDRTLVHEAVHLWQHQQGGTAYMAKALWAQFLGDGYDWRKGVAQGRPFARLNPEQQASLVEAAFAAGAALEPGPDAGPLERAFCEALRSLRAGRGAP